jgi:hypothetical protein
MELAAFLEVNFSRHIGFEQASSSYGTGSNQSVEARIDRKRSSFCLKSAGMENP